MGGGAGRGPARRRSPLHREPGACSLGLPVVRGVEEERAQSGGETPGAPRLLLRGEHREGQAALGAATGRTCQAASPKRQRPARHRNFRRIPCLA